MVISDRTRGNGLKLRMGGVWVGNRMRFLTQRVFRHWNRLPREVDTALSLTEFKKRFDSALRHMV